MSTASIFPALSALRDQLASLPGVKTCRVGMESGITPADYPMIRIVPRTIGAGVSLARRSTDVLIYFGEPIHEFTGGLESQWSALLDMERQLIDAAQQTPGVSVIYRGTLLDEDRLTAYKILALECDVVA